MIERARLWRKFAGQRNGIFRCGSVPLKGDETIDLRPYSNVGDIRSNLNDHA
jgi:hypothetical protein